MTRCAHQYGDVVCFWLGRWSVYLLSHPDLIETMLLARHRDFTKHRFFWCHVETLRGGEQRVAVR